MTLKDTNNPATYTQLNLTWRKESQTTTLNRGMITTIFTDDYKINGKDTTRRDCAFVEHVCPYHDRGHGGLVIGSRPRGRRVSKPDFTEEQPCKWARCTLNPSSRMSSRWCGAKVRRGDCQLKCRPRQLTAVTNFEVRPKIALSCCSKTGRKYN
ncbi:hypothetical protein AVEN_243017-1 [Araneus ventricosus]|uniref:Uncharacterized protein n=1 Tax=Araneus ventricosus TaxID=182803 RepID=A0A4Y2D4V9_ARAVE|nr:hypothetical protein AVEN_243017-1 [Araneus ventricosus]